MPLSVAITTTASPPRNSAGRCIGHARAGWRRRTRRTPHRYKPAATTAKAVITGANCHRVTTSAKLKGGSASCPMPARLLPGGQPRRSRPAEGVRFEPTVTLPPQWFSRPSPSATRRALLWRTSLRYPGRHPARPGPAVAHAGGQRQVRLGGIAAEQFEFDLRALLQVRVVGD